MSRQCREFRSLERCDVVRKLNTVNSKSVSESFTPDWPTPGGYFDSGAFERYLPSWELISYGNVSFSREGHILIY